MLTNGICTNQNLSLKNEMHKILWEFKLQTDHQILAIRQDLEFAWIVCELQTDHQILAIRQDLVLNNKKRICQRAEEVMEHESEGDTNYSWCT